MALQVRIRKKLGNFCLNVDFEMSEGVFAILGASGCGKSMTLKCIAGIETPDEGRIVLNDRVFFDFEKKINLPPQKRRVGYMFQDYALFPNMTVEQNIIAGMGRKCERNAVAEYVRRFHLGGLEKHYPAQLSGGQKQRVAMARMIAAKPDMILLDEPFSALDSYLKWEMEQQMREILEDVGKPALFVSHNRDEVYRMCSMVSCMNQGKMEVIEPVREFFRNPKTKTAAILSGCKNISSIEVLDELHVRAVDWNKVLTVSFVPPEAKAVGIRAHYFSTEPEGENCFQLKESRMIEEPFEWTIYFREKADGDWLQWKIAKAEWEEGRCIPEYLYLKKDDILLLTDPKPDGNN